MASGKKHAGRAPIPGAHWLLVDLEATCVVERIDVEFESAFARDYTLKGRSKSGAWVSLAVGASAVESRPSKQRILHRLASNSMVPVDHQIGHRAAGGRGGDSVYELVFGWSLGKAADFDEDARDACGSKEGMMGVLEKPPLLPGARFVSCPAVSRSVPLLVASKACLSFAQVNADRQRPQARHALCRRDVGRRARQLRRLPLVRRPSSSRSRRSRRQSTSELPDGRGKWWNKMLKTKAVAALKGKGKKLMPGEHRAGATPRWTSVRRCSRGSSSRPDPPTAPRTRLGREPQLACCPNGDKSGGSA